MNSEKKCGRCHLTWDKKFFSKNPRSADGLDAWCKSCRNSYYLERRSLKLPVMYSDDLTKQCRRCEQIKDRRNFKSSDSTYCKDCSSLIGRGANLKKYGLTVDDYIKMEQERNGLCDICGKPEMKKSRLSIDHDHSCCPGAGSCGKCVRGLLCSKCNMALGLVSDNTDILRAMIKYLS